MATETDNLALAQQINQLLQERNDLLEQQAKVLSQQVEIGRKLSEILGGKSLDRNTESVRDLTGSIREASDEVENITGNTRELKSALDDASNSGGGMTSAITSLAGTAFSAVGIFKTMFSIIGGVGAIVKNVAKGFVGLSTSIVSIPFKILGNLTAAAGSLSGAIDPVRQQMEEIRKQFGDLASNEGAALASTLGQFKSEMGDVGGTGLRLSQVFGYGREGLAAAMKYSQEMAGALGASFNQMIPEIEANAAKLAMLTKGFTGSAEATASMLKHARGLGEQGTSYITEITGMSMIMSQKFGISSKVIGKSIGEMTNNISDFGSLSKKQMVSAAVYAGKLGVEIKDLSNVMNKFLNFEDAAKGAAEMAQAFGMNVDTMELMKGGPEAIEAMRKAFFASGKTIKDLSTAERKLLETQTGLTGAALESAFSAENQSVSYDQITDASADAEKQQMSQVEVMNKLADSIERVFGQGNRQFTSFFDAFKQGLVSGMERSKEWRTLMYTISRALRVVYIAGVDLGRFIMREFPGIKDVFGGLTEMFNPARFSALMNKVTGAFKTFILLIKSGEIDAKSAIGGLFGAIKNAFMDFFQSGKAGGTKVLQGAGTIGVTIKNIFIGLASYAVEGLVIAVRGIRKWLENDGPKNIKTPAVLNSLKKTFEELWTELSKTAITLFQKVAKVIKENWPAIKKSLEDLWQTMVVDTGLREKVQGYLFEFLRSSITLAIIKEGLSALGGYALSAIGSAISGAFGGGGAAAAAGAIGKGFAKFMKGALGKALIVTTLVSAAVDINASIQEFSDKLIKEGFDPADATIGAGFAGLINTLTMGLLSPETIGSIARSFAGFSESIFGFLGSYLGEDFSKGLKQSLSGAFNIVGSLGDAISALWEGDSAQFMTAMENLLLGLMDQITGLAKGLVFGVTSLGKKIVLGLLDGLMFIFDKIENIFNALSDIPLIGYLFKAIAGLSRAVREFFHGIKYHIEQFIEIAAGFDPFEKLLGAFEWIVVELPKKASSLVEGFLGAISSLPGKILEPFEGAYKAVTGFFGINSPSKLFSEMGGHVADGFLEMIQFLPKRMLSFFTDAYQGVKNFFGISSPSKLFAEMGGNLKDGLEEGIEPEGDSGIFDSFTGFIKGGADSFISGASGLIKSALGGAFDIAGGVIETILAPLGTKLLDAFAGLLKPIAGILEPIIKNAFSSLVDILITDLEILIKTLGPVVELAFSKLSTVFSGAFSVLFEKFGQSDTIKSAFTAIADGFVKGLSTLLVLIKDAIAPAMPYIGKIISESLTFAMENISTVLNNMPLANTVVDTISVQFDQITDSTGDIVKAKVESFSRGLGVLRDFSRSLDGANPEVKMAVDIGKSLSGNGKVTVEVKPASFNFNINVKMDAEKVAEGIAGTDKFKNVVGLA